MLFTILCVVKIDTTTDGRKSGISPSGCLHVFFSLRINSLSLEVAKTEMHSLRMEIIWTASCRECGRNIATLQAVVRAAAFDDS